jgi:NADH:ubiquinone oxidoreductase subunit E
MSDKVTKERTHEGLLIALQEAQTKHGYLKSEFMTELAESFDLPVSEVYGVASFYSFLTTKATGRNIIRICKSLPCYLANGQTIIEAVQGEIGIGPGETTADGRFSFELTNCIGLCDRPPAMLINNDPHVDLTPEKIASILKGYK